MRFAYTILYVRDVLASVEFYEQAFGFDRRMVSEHADYAELATGDTVLALAANRFMEKNLLGGFVANDPGAPPAGFEIAFTTDDVEAAYESAIGAGARPVDEPHERPWGQRMAYVRDPDGILIELATPM
jgi:lactoylglutathione lyase